MSITIQKGGTAAYVTVLAPGQTVPSSYQSGDLIFQPNPDGTFSFIHKFGYFPNLFNLVPTQVINGDTSTPFANLAAVATYVNANFFSKAGGSSGSGVLTFGTHLVSGGTSYDTSANVTISSDATNAATANTIVSRDANSNIILNNLIENGEAVTTSGTTTTLTTSSPYLTFFTGSANQTLVMPVVSTLAIYQSFLIINQSTGVITVNSSGGNLIQSMDVGSSAFFNCIAITGTSVASWNVNYFPITQFVTGTFNGAGTNASPFTLNTSTTPTSGSSLPITSNGVYGALANYVNILAPQLTTSSTNGYVWTAVGTTGGGSWQAAGGSGLPLSWAANQTLTTNGYTLTLSGNASGAGLNPVQLFLSDPSNNTFPTSIGIFGPVSGQLLLGGNGANYIQAGTTSTGGRLLFYTNCTNAQGTTPNGILSLTLDAAGVATFAQAVIANSSFTAKSAILGSTTGTAFLTTPDAGNNYTYMEMLNGGSGTFFARSTSAGGGFISGAGAFATVITTLDATNIVLGSNLVNDFCIFSSHRISMGSATDDGTNKLQVNGTIAATSVNVKASANLTAQTAAVASVAAYTLPAATGTYSVAAYLNITAVATDVIETQVTYQDENGTTQTSTFFNQGSTTALLSAIGNSTYPPMTIRVNASSTITVKTTLTTGVGSITYDVGATITKIQ